MIDLTPLDVRKKRGDFKKMLRGYDPQEVDTFLELVAERLEVLVKESMSLKERTDMLAEQVKTQEGREKAIQEALVTAQTLREDISQQAAREAEAIREQAKREADMVTRQAEAEAAQMRDRVAAEVAQIRQQAVGDTELLRKRTEGELERLTHELEGLIESKTGIIDELERKRTRFLRAFRSLLERELDAVAIEEGKVASEDAILELDLTGGQRRVQARMIETAALDMLQDDGGEAASTSVAEPDPAEAVAFEMEPETSSDDGAMDAIEVVEVVEAEDDGAEEALRMPAAALEGSEPDAADELVADFSEQPAVEFPGEAELDQAVDAVLMDDSPTLIQPTYEAPSEPPRDEFGEDVQVSSLTGPDAHDRASEESEVVPMADEYAGASDETLVDQVFTILDETPDPQAMEGSGPDQVTEEGDSPMEALPVQETPAASTDDVISINTLAPEPAEPFDDEARAAVNQLFDRGDVPVAPPEAPSEEVEDSWSKVLRGEDGGTTEGNASDSKGSWSPNFPDKGRKSEGSGWTRSKDPSRWR